jgi:hypothetical protein
MSAVVKNKTIGRRSFRELIAILLILLLLFMGSVNVVGAILYQIGAPRQGQLRLIRGTLFAPVNL